MRRHGLLLVLAAAVLAASPPPAAADRATAEFFFDRGEKSLEERKWSEAADHYRRSLTEDETFLPARYGLAQAILGEGRTQEGIDELRTFVDAAAAAADPPGNSKLLLLRAKKQLAEIDASTTELDQLRNRFADDLVALSKKWETRDRTLAEKALRNALKVVPGHQKAEGALKKMGLTVSKAIALFNGKDLDGCPRG